MNFWKWSNMTSTRRSGQNWRSKGMLFTNCHLSMIKDSKVLWSPGKRVSMSHNRLQKPVKDQFKKWRLLISRINQRSLWRKRLRRRPFKKLGETPAVMKMMLRMTRALLKTKSCKLEKCSRENQPRVMGPQRKNLKLWSHPKRNTTVMRLKESIRDKDKSWLDLKKWSHKRTWKILTSRSRKEMRGSLKW